MSGMDKLREALNTPPTGGPFALAAQIENDRMAYEYADRRARMIANNAVRDAWLDAYAKAMKEQGIA